MGVKEDLKSILAKEGETITSIALKMQKATGKPYSLKSISDKLARKTLRYEEFLLIMDILGYEIEYKRKK